MSQVLQERTGSHVVVLTVSWCLLEEEYCPGSGEEAGSDSCSSGEEEEEGEEEGEEEESIVTPVKKVATWCDLAVYHFLFLSSHEEPDQLPLPKLLPHASQLSRSPMAPPPLTLPPLTLVPAYMTSWNGSRQDTECGPLFYS